VHNLVICVLKLLKNIDVLNVQAGKVLEDLIVRPSLNVLKKKTAKLKFISDSFLLSSTASDRKFKISNHPLFSRNNHRLCCMTRVLKETY